jgi:hypothetical protein
MIYVILGKAQRLSCAFFVDVIMLKGVEVLKKIRFVVVTLI